MTALLDKSRQNYTVALQLFEQKEYLAPVIHCSYYSCIQLMTHILLTFGGKSETDIDYFTKSASSHSYLIDQIRNILQKRNSASANRIISKINDLKTLRVKSDYKNHEVTKDEADKATMISQTVNSSLKQTFNI